VDLRYGGWFEGVLHLVVVRRVCERGLREVGLSRRNKVIGRPVLAVFFEVAALVALVDWGAVLSQPVVVVAPVRQGVSLLVF
jgi:hypothetical protein